MGTPLGSNQMNLHRLNVSYLTHLINCWWNNEYLEDDKKKQLTSANPVEIPKPTKPMSPTLTQLPLLYTEPILTEPKILVLHPCNINHSSIKWFKKQQVCLWTAEEIDTACNLDDFTKLSDPEQSFVKTILAFFAIANSIVMDNLMEQFGDKVNAFDIKLFLVIQTECVLTETYINLLTAIMKDETE